MSARHTLYSALLGLILGRGIGCASNAAIPEPDGALDRPIAAMAIASALLVAWIVCRDRFPHWLRVRRLRLSKNRRVHA